MAARRHSRPPADAECRRLSAGRRRADPDRRRASRSTARAFDFRQARPIRMETEGEQTALRPQFLPCRARAAPLKQAAWVQGADFRRRDGGLDHGARRPALYRPASGARRRRAWTGAATRPLPASAWSRRSGRIRRTARISRRRRCGRARSIGRRRSTGSGCPRRVSVGLSNASRKRLERRQRAAHLHDGGGDAMRACAPPRAGAMAGKPGGEIGAIEGIAGAGRVDGRGDMDRRHVAQRSVARQSAPAPRHS